MLTLRMFVRRRASRYGGHVERRNYRLQDISAFAAPRLWRTRRSPLATAGNWKRHSASSRQLSGADR
jgi:hypothetical protein